MLATRQRCKRRKRGAAVSTALGALIFMTAAISVFASFNLIEVHSSGNLYADTIVDVLLDRKNQEMLNASWVSSGQGSQQQEGEILATSEGDSTAIIIGIVSIEATSGNLQLIPESIAIPSGATVIVCRENQCPIVAANMSRIGLLTFLGNVVWVVYPGQRFTFDITLSNTSSATLPGRSNATTVTLTSLNGYNQKVMLYAENSPPGVNITFVPQIFTPTFAGATASMIFNVSSSAPAGTYTIYVVAKGADGVTNSTTYSLTV